MGILEVYQESTENTTKKLYTDIRTLYINDKPVSYYRIENLRYGEPIAQKTPIKDFEELHNVAGYCGDWHSPITFCIGSKKIKIGRTTFLREDVNSIYLLKHSKELKEDHLNFLDLSRKLTVPEFIDFCRDKGLEVSNC